MKRVARGVVALITAAFLTVVLVLPAHANTLLSLISVSGTVQTECCAVARRAGEPTPIVTVASSGANYTVMIGGDADPSTGEIVWRTSNESADYDACLDGGCASPMESVQLAASSHGTVTIPVQSLLRTVDALHSSGPVTLTLSF